MADETITGCVNWANKNIRFDQDSCTYAGCIIWDGIHAGQVAITISNDNCDDTYYADIDWSTGRWQLTLPDICCPWSSDDCSYCDPILTPSNLHLVFTGVNDDICNYIWGTPSPFKSFKVTGIASTINRSEGWWIPQSPFPDLCKWYDKFEISVGQFERYDNSGDCSSPATPSATFDITDLDIEVEFFAGGTMLGVNMRLYGFNGPILDIAFIVVDYIADVESGSCVGVIDLANESHLVPNPGFDVCTGGTVTITP